MKVKTLTLLFLVLLSSYVCGQDVQDWNYTSRWQTRPSVGINLPITKLFGGAITDPLIRYSDQSYYLQLISATYFFSKHWGVELNIQGIYSSEISNENERYSKSMKEEYGDQYFVTPSSDSQYDAVPFFFGNVNRGFIGLIYRVEIKRLFFYPKMALGLTSFDTNEGGAYLKEKNSNTVLFVEHSTGGIKLVSENFTLAPSLTMGYKLSKRIFINVDVMTSWFKTDFTYTEFTTDMSNLEENPGTKYVYKKDIFTLSVGTGLIIVIK